MRNFIRPLLVAVIAFAIAAASAGVPAQTWPARPVRMVSPYAPGGSNDTSARIIAEQLSRRLGQSFVVENKPGAGTRLANEFVARATPDGYTLLYGAATLGVGQAYFKQVNYDVAKDFAPILLTVVGPVFLVVNAESPVRTVKDFVTMARARPAGVNFGSPGAGSGPHLTAELFGYLGKFKLINIHLRGDVPSYTELLGGRVDATMTAITSGLAHVKAGKLRVIAVASEERSALYPDAPTFRELGMDMTGYGWFGLLAPAGTPAAIVERLNTEVNAILREPDVNKRMLDAGLQTAGGTPKAFDAFIAREVAKWTDVVRNAKIEREN